MLLKVKWHLTFIFNSYLMNVEDRNSKANVNVPYIRGLNNYFAGMFQYIGRKIFFSANATKFHPFLFLNDF